MACSQGEDLAAQAVEVKGIKVLAAQLDGKGHVAAVFFGDGGITTLGANCFNMAIVGSLTAYASYRMIASGAAIASRRRWVAAAIAGYVATNAAAFVTALEFGIQPMFFHDTRGVPLYDLPVEYLNWFVVMNLLTKPQADQYLKQFRGGGSSTCLLRTEFDDHACQSMFFRSPGQLWDSGHYLDIGRQAMRELIDRTNSDIDRFRYDLLDQHPKPTEGQVRHWLAGNLCRCTGYDKIIRAVLDTAAELRGATR
jgi:hypothetical protein